MNKLLYIAIIALLPTQTYGMLNFARKTVSPTSVRLTHSAPEAAASAQKNQHSQFEAAEITAVIQAAKEKLTSEQLHAKTTLIHGMHNQLEKQTSELSASQMRHAQLTRRITWLQRQRTALLFSLGITSGMLTQYAYAPHIQSACDAVKRIPTHITSYIQECKYATKKWFYNHVNNVKESARETSDSIIGEDWELAPRQKVTVVIPTAEPVIHTPEQIVTVPPVITAPITPLDTYIDETYWIENSPYITSNGLSEAAQAKIRANVQRVAETGQCDYCDLRFSDLTQAFKQARAAGKRISLVSADARGASLKGAPLEKATLWGINLSDADLTDANCRYANINFGKLPRAILNRTDFSYASLGATDLQDTAREGAIFDNTDLRMAKLDNIEDGQ